MAGEENGAPKGIVAAETSEIRNLIYTVRGMQVMQDSDLAALYGVETKVLNQAANRNASRFPERYRFQLTDDEVSLLRSQIVTSKEERRGGRRYRPFAYSEQGVSMLSAVLRSKTAVEVSIRIMDSFVEMRRFIAGNAALLDRVRGVELRQLEYQRTTDERFERVISLGMGAVSSSGPGRVMAP